VKRTSSTLRRNKNLNLNEEVLHALVAASGQATNSQDRSHIVSDLETVERELLYRRKKAPATEHKKIDAALDIIRPAITPLKE
jgi:hypothetical protein